MTSLVIAEHDNKVLNDSTAKTVAAAAQLGQPVHVLVAGQDAGAVADAASKLAGVEKVLLADDAIYARMLAEPMEALILASPANYDAILAPATTNGKNYMPRVAAKLDVPQISEILYVVSRPIPSTRPIYAGNAIQTVQAPAGKKVITVRTTAFKAAAKARAGARSRRSRPPPIRAFRNSSAKRFRNRNVPNSPPPRSSSRADAA